MSATDANRPVRVTSPFGADVLLFARLTGTDRLSQPFEYEVSVLSEAGELDALKILGKPVIVTCYGDDGTPLRAFHGLASDFTQLSYGERFHEYRITLRPWFWFLTRTADCRVFQDMTVPEIFEQVVKELGFFDFQLSLNKSYKKHAYCVQYRETTFNFLSRLLEQEGIYYCLVHAPDRHKMVLLDDVASHPTIKGYEEVPYFPPGHNVDRRGRDHLTSWNRSRSVQPGKYVTTDFDFKTPAGDLRETLASPKQHTLGGLEIFDYPAVLPAKPDADSSALDRADAARIAGVRLDELQAGHSVSRGEGNAIGLLTGTVFSLTHHPRGDYNVEYQIVGTSCSIASNAHETGNASDADFHVSVEAIDTQTQFRPPRVTPKPVIQGAQTAIVVGKAGEEIDTDEYGRIKVQFHWDRCGKRDDKTSCRLRVAQAWAGQQWGAIHIPRIGQEVIVSFLEGDPDRPIVTGSVYNGANKPPYTLPANATQSGLKSRSSKQGDAKNFNEIRFEDKKGGEELLIHAEKDFKLDVENDATWRVGLNEASPAKSSKGVARYEIGKTLTIDVGDEITLVTGQSKIVMKKDGSIAITCIKLEVKAQQLIDLNSKQKMQLEGLQQFAAKSLQVSVEGTTKVEVKSSVSTKVEGTLLDLSANGIATLKGALTKIG
jgi:type VI secretion system secreted protein VgrG